MVVQYFFLFKIFFSFFSFSSSLWQLFLVSLALCALNVVDVFQASSLCFSPGLPADLEHGLPDLCPPIPSVCRLLRIGSHSSELSSELQTRCLRTFPITFLMTLKAEYFCNVYLRKGYHQLLGCPAWNPVSLSPHVLPTSIAPVSHHVLPVKYLQSAASLCPAAFHHDSLSQMSAHL